MQLGIQLVGGPTAIREHLDPVGREFPPSAGRVLCTTTAAEEIGSTGRI
jgi:hypothetical protein